MNKPENPPILTKKDEYSELLQLLVKQGYLN